MEDDQFNEDYYVHQMNQGPIPNMPNEINLDNTKDKKVKNELSLEGIINNNKIYFKLNKDPKKILNLKDSDRVYNIYVPIYLNKKELYESLTGILSMKLSALIYDNNVLEYDDSSIDDIEEGGDLFILYKGESYADYLNKAYKSNQKIYIKVISNTESIMGLPDEVSVSEMIKAILIKYDMFTYNDNYKNCALIYNALKMDFNDQRKIIDVFRAEQVSLYLSSPNLLGFQMLKIDITAIVFERKREIIKEIKCNKFQPLRDLFAKIENMFEFQIDKILIGNNEINKNTEKSFASIKVNDKIFCNIENDSIHIYSNFDLSSI